jgi:hypothetical protein
MKTTSPRVTKLAQNPDGYWTANVSLNGQTVSVDDRDGSWLANVRPFPGARSFVRREVLPEIAALLQARKRTAGGRVVRRAKMG